jgi:anti-sigma28 factor (negative regulator of flagellin synthesis)
MTREEMLKLAAEKGGTPQEIMAFVREMAAFLKEGTERTPVAPPPPTPTNQPEYRMSKVGNRLVSNAAKARKHWNKDEIEFVKQAMKENMPMSEIANLLGRPVNGILKAIRTEKFQ